jgi:hypothetical protein
MDVLYDLDNGMDVTWSRRMVGETIVGLFGFASGPFLLVSFRRDRRLAEAGA